VTITKKSDPRSRNSLDKPTKYVILLPLTLSPSLPCTVKSVQRVGRSGDGRRGKTLRADEQHQQEFKFSEEGKIFPITLPPLALLLLSRVCMESAAANGREPKSCLGHVFNFKIGHFPVMKEVHGANARPYLKLKIWPGFCPASLRLSLVWT